MVFVEVFLAFSAIAALLVGISVDRRWTSREQQGRTLDPVRWDDRCQPNSRQGRAPEPFGGEPTQFKEWIFAVDLSLRTGMIKNALRFQASGDAEIKTVPRHFARANQADRCKTLLHCAQRLTP